MANESISEVIKGGYCIGCGVCAYRFPDHYHIEFNKYGRYIAVEENGDNGKPGGPICPFSDESDNEDVLAGNIFPTLPRDKEIGRYSGIYAGYVSEEPYRDLAGSGGMGTWILCELLDKGLIDGVIQVAPRNPTKSNPSLFEYTVNYDKASIKEAARSRYYPIELSSVLSLVKESEGRYALTGLPCFITAVRLLLLTDEALNNRIQYFVGLFCGHLKSHHFASSLAWQMGIPNTDLRGFNFRYKTPGRPANDYSVQAKSATQIKTTRSLDLFGSDWGLGLFKYKGCDYCDDIVAETADISLGDAWLPQYSSDWRGTNIIITRNLEIANLIENAHNEGRIVLDGITTDQIVSSQSANYRHRREGLGYRLHLADKKGQWHPTKRVSRNPMRGQPMKRLMHRMRTRISEQSHSAFCEALEGNDFSIFRKRLFFKITIYRLANYRQSFRAINKRALSLVRKLIHR
jgi:coenzyme F420-reducing hydrogenase beta subunit